MFYESFSPRDTEAIAQSMAQHVSRGDIVCLTGDLGGGKTIFAKGFAKGLGIEALITSPTFTLMNAYEQRVGLSLYHFDVYRISSSAEMEDTGCEEYFYGDGVCLIEWAEQIRELIPNSALWVGIEKNLVKGENYRMIHIHRDDLP